MLEVSTGGRLQSLLRPLDAVNWKNADQTHEVTGEVLKALKSDRVLLGELVRSLRDDEDRFSRCEKDNQFQLLLFESSSGSYRIRLHVMPEGMYDYPHGHRYSFGSIVLSGVLEQTIFSFLDWGQEPIAQDAMAMVSFVVHPGETYCLNFAAVHKVKVRSAPVVTLFLRSAALKDQASNLDTATGEHRWQRSASTGQSEGQHRPLRRSELEDIISNLTELDVIAPDPAA